MCRVVSFASGKGGVGKTSLVSNLGILSAESGKKTLLVDADWSLGKLGIVLGARPRWTVDQVLAGQITLEEAILPVRENLSLLGSPTGLVGFEELNEALRNQLYYELDRVLSSYDSVFLDHSSGIHWGVLQFASAAHQHVIVTTCEPTSYTDAYAIMKVLTKRFSIRNFGLVVTMSDSEKESEQVIRRFKDVVHSHLDVRLDVLNVIPRENKMSEAIIRQTPFVEKFPDHAVTVRLQSLLKRIESEPLFPTGRLLFNFNKETHAPRGNP
jgi:flagellar biosynthesis protein FlhG